MKKFGRMLTLLIILGAAGYVFYHGWAQLKISTNSCGVLVSKTGGVDPEPIVPGVFTWHWETLLPTNAQIRVFSRSPYRVSRTVEGTLPSAELYSTLLKISDGFSYEFQFDISLRCTPEGIVRQVVDKNTADDAELQAALTLAAEHAADGVGAGIVAEMLKDAGYVPSAESAKALLNRYIADNEEFAGIEITDFSITYKKVPDMHVYGRAKSSYETYHTKLDELLARQAAKDAEEISGRNKEMARLAKLGEVLRSYPELSDILKSSNAVETIKALKELQ